MKDEDVLEELIGESLRRIRAWEPPANFGQRLAVSLPQAEAPVRFRLQMPPIPAPAAAGLAAAAIGAFGQDLRTVAPAWLIGTVMVGVISWSVGNLTRSKSPA